VLVLVGNLWFWRSSETGCSAMRFPTSAPSQDRSVERTDFLESIEEVQHLTLTHGFRNALTFVVKK